MINEHHHAKCVEASIANLKRAMVSFYVWVRSNGHRFKVEDLPSTEDTFHMNIGAAAMEFAKNPEFVSMIGPDILCAVLLFLQANEGYDTSLKFRDQP